MLPTKNTWKGILMLQIQLAQGVMRKIGLASYKKSSWHNIWKITKRFWRGNSKRYRVIVQKRFFGEWFTELYISSLTENIAKF